MNDMTLNTTNINGTIHCEGCRELIDTATDFGKFDPRVPVYTDDYVYHLDCEDSVFEWRSER